MSFERRMERRTKLYELHAERQLRKGGTCRRCQQPARTHRAGVCPDGLGTFSWAAGKNAESDERPNEEPVVLEKDEQRLFDLLGALTGTDTPRNPPALSKALAIPLPRLKRLLGSLARKGLIQPRSSPPCPPP